MSKPKTLSGANVVIKLGDKIIGRVENIQFVPTDWRKEGDPVSMEKARKLAEEIEFDYFRGKADFSNAKEVMPEVAWPMRIIVNGEEIP